jgi:hypothetical protein
MARKSPWKQPALADGEITARIVAGTSSVGRKKQDRRRREDQPLIAKRRLPRLFEQLG